MLRDNEKNLHQAMFCVRNILLREGGFLKLLFKIFDNILSLIVRNLEKEKKNEVLFILFQKSQMGFNGLTVHVVINITTTNDAKIAQKMPQYYFSAIIIWHLFQKGFYKDTMTNDFVWLSCYV